MKVLALNGSQRREGNTAVLLGAALDGAKAAGAETEMLQFADMSFKGCRACYGCKLRGKPVEYCVIRDDLQEVLKKAMECDILVIGTPIYFSDVTGEVRNFINRFIYPHLSYSTGPAHFRKPVRSLMVYSGNVMEDQIREGLYRPLMEQNKEWLEMYAGPSEYFVASETPMFDDLERYDGDFYKMPGVMERRGVLLEENKKKLFEKLKEMAVK